MSKIITSIDSYDPTFCLTDTHLLNYNALVCFAVVGQSLWLQSLATYSYSEMRHLHYKLQKKIPFDGEIKSFTVIGEAMGVLVESRMLYILNRDGKHTRKIKSKISIVKVTQGYSGDLIVASSHGIHLINNTGRLIENIYINSELYFIDLLLWKGDLYVLSTRKMYIFVNETAEVKAEVMPLSISAICSSKQDFIIVMVICLQCLSEKTHCIYICGI